MGLIVAGVLGSVTKKKFREQQVTFGKKANAINKTGAQIATDILQKNGIMNVRVIRGQEGTDHYNSKTNVISLSPSVHDSASVYAMSVAAHEVGHAIQ
ncbi:MAG: hypothetical protein DRP42_01685 [Tenericutes bacterium]|nr:MAG: hypothetical protein DRP42_01685 [Mycoplasmatota bacterium]